ncbi:MAG: O-antigen ligase family protein, partial [bacterium]
STRAFYLGLIFVSFTYCFFLFIVNRHNNISSRFKSPSILLGALLSSFAIFAITQTYLYPKNTDKTYNAAVTERLSTISSREISTLLRIDSWKRSAILFKQDPLLGVGIGNWKIRVLKYENPTSSDFTFMFKNHNDFIEITTETGVFGGLLFISLFFFLFRNFLNAFFKPDRTEDSGAYLFVPAFGILCYSFDAFFNFPADRPEIQSIFAIFIGAGIAFSPIHIGTGKLINFSLIYLIQFIPVLALLGASYILLLNFNTLKLQFIANEDLRQDKLSYASKLLKQDPGSYLNVSSAAADPIFICKSRYLIGEGKYQDAINILRPDNSNPYLGRRELFMAVAFSKMGNNDSALAYANKVHDIKPRQSTAVGIICNILNARNRQAESIKMMTEFLANEKQNKQAWLDLTMLYRESCNYQKAFQTIYSALKQFPEDSTLLLEKIKLQRDEKIFPLQKIYSNAMANLADKKYPEALKYLNEFISKEPRVAIVYAGRAYCYYYGKEFKNCISDIDRSIELGNSTPDLLNLRGLCFKALGQAEAACKNFQNAATQGNKDAINNVQRFCKGH